MADNQPFQRGAAVADSDWPSRSDTLVAPEADGAGELEQDAAAAAELEKRIEAARAEAKAEAEREAERKWKQIANRDTARYQSEAAREKALREQAERERDEYRGWMETNLSSVEKNDLRQMELRHERSRLDAERALREAADNDAELRQRQEEFVQRIHTNRMEWLSELGLDPGSDADVRTILDQSYTGDPKTGSGWPSWEASDHYLRTEVSRLLKKRGALNAGKKDEESAPARKPADPVPNPGVGRGGTAVRDFMTTPASDLIAEGLKADAARRRRQS